MGIELEWKYRATPEILKQIAAAVAGPSQYYNMETTYYDTPNGALSQRHCTLRRRMENDHSICTLKMPSGGQGRAEFEVECDSIQKALPELCKLSGFRELEELGIAGVRPVCGAQFRRTAITVLLPDCEVELALDQGILSGGGREEPLCELEVELKSGSAEAAALYAKALALGYGLTPESKSKFRRASLLAGGK